MYKKLVILIYLSILLVGSLSAQNAVFASKSHYLGIRYGAISTGKVDVYRNYVKNEINDIRSIPTLGSELRIHYLYLLNPKLQFESAIIIGGYGATFRVILSDEFFHLGWGGFDESFTEAIANYYGLNIGLNYSLYSNGKINANLGVSFNTVKFRTMWFGESVLDLAATPGALGEAPMKTMFYSSFRLNENKDVWFTPELKLRFEYKLDSRFVLAVALSGTYSKTPFMKVDRFELIGDSEVLDGRIEEQFKHWGLGFAVFYKIK